MSERPSELPAELPSELIALWDACVAGFVLGPHSLHGPRHWRNVYFNGMQLVADSGGAADVTIVRLFAILHDARRLSEGHDPDHGQRAADLAATWRGSHFDLDDARLAILTTACVDPTIGAC